VKIHERGLEVETGVTLATWLVDGGLGTLPPPFLLVHGLASNSRLWDMMALDLARAGHVVGAVDLRGHGRSDKPDHGYDMSTLVSDLLAVINGLGLKSPILVGQSFGANLVLETAWRSPQVAGGIVCVDGGTIELSHTFPDWQDAAKALAPPRLAGTPYDEMRRMLLGLHPTWPATAVEATMANFDLDADGRIAPRLSREHHMEILHSLWEHRPSSRFAELTVPTLLVFAGLGGPPSKRWAARSAEQAIPDVRVEWFESAGHDLHAECPDELAQLLLRRVAEGFFTGSSAPGETVVAPDALGTGPDG